MRMSLDWKKMPPVSGMEWKGMHYDSLQRDKARGGHWHSML